MRVHEMAKAKGLSSKKLLDILSEGGFDLPSHMSVLKDDAISYINKHFDKSSAPSETKASAPVSTEAKPSPAKPDNKTSTQARPSRPTHRSSSQGGQKSKKKNQKKKRFEKRSGFSRYNDKPKIVTEITISQDMALFEAAELMGKTSSELILALMSDGMVCNRNYVLPKSIIASLASKFGINVLEAQGDKLKLKTTEGTTRWPIVVVMGHVDHGKTSLLDFIRKTSVASREKGGITQHIGAYDVETSHGKLVFLDTPGHAAFSHMRRRGTKVTDIAVLVVAADDGVMPQTVEALNVAKEAGVTIVVAINKIDKVDSATVAIETIKRQLSQHGLMAEDWGGDTVFVPISAKTGDGIDELLDMLVLQSEIMELKADPKLPARAFVLESHVEKGYGSVSTAICVDGTIKQGDYFLCGSTKGKVRLLIDANGKKITQAGPSVPVKIVGFDQLASSGDVLQVVTYGEYVKEKPLKTFSQNYTSGNEKEEYINLIVKADTYGSSEAIVDHIKELNDKGEVERKSFSIVQSGVGNVTEGDVTLAKDTNSMLIAMNVRVERNAESLARESSVKIIEGNIIYRLSEQLEDILKASEVKPIITKKVAEAVVIKVFNIKGVGVIAGARVKSGVFARNASAVCIRNNEELGSAQITSLERKNKSVKEVHVDTEFAFITKDFQDWQVGDVVHCVVEVTEG